MLKDLTNSHSRNHKISQLLNRRQKDITVFMDEVHKPHNLAAIVRTCDAVGIGEVHAVYPDYILHPDKQLRECHGTAVGSNRWVKTHAYSDLSTGIDQVKSEGKQVLAAHMSDRAVDFRKIDYTQPTAILVGSELFGVSEHAASLADEHITIPMVGMVQSLNVSVATAIILYEAQRQREIAGGYAERQLTEQQCESLRLEWLHPRVKNLCDQHEIRYPKINNEGNIEDKEWNILRQSVTK